jgi:hypothetical protein
MASGSQWIETARASILVPTRYVQPVSFSITLIAVAPLAMR